MVTSTSSDQQQHQDIDNNTSSSDNGGHNNGQHNHGFNPVNGNKRTSVNGRLTNSSLSTIPSNNSVTTISNNGNNQRNQINPDLITNENGGHNGRSLRRNPMYLPGKSGTIS